MPAGEKTLHFFEGGGNYHVLKMQLLREIRLVYKKGIPVDYDSKSLKSLYDNLEQKEGERAKAGEFNASKG